MKIEFKNMKKGKIMGAFIFILAAALCVSVYLHLPMFGALPRGGRLERIKLSPNYRGGEFRNKEETPVMTAEGFDGIRNYLFRKKVRLKPRVAMPSVKTDLKKLSREEDVLVWFGHSSFFLQLSGKRILVDPVFSPVSSPVLFYPSSFKGTDIYSPEDMPEIDCLFLTHDHWDHLDHKTMLAMKSKVKKIITGLGVGAHLERWGFDKDKITEADWNETTILDEKIKVHILPARHFSGRGLIRNKSLWVSFLIETPDFKLFLSGDSGYGKHFAEIGEKFGPVDLAVMDSGQHDKDWKYVHMMSDEVVKAAKELKAKRLFMAHLGRLCISNHPWDEPFIEITEMSADAPYSLMTPVIGEKADLRKTDQVFTHWWEGLE